MGREDPKDATRGSPLAVIWIVLVLCIAAVLIATLWYRSVPKVG
jgi:hypothetical protein